jgi:hypothetical protein
MELVDEWHLASARAIQWGYPVLGRDRISQSVDADLPFTLMRAFSAVPSALFQECETAIDGIRISGRA